MDSKIINALDDGVVILDNNGKITDCNRAAINLLGLPKNTPNRLTIDQIINQPLFDEFWSQKSKSQVNIQFKKTSWLGLTLKKLDQKNYILTIKDITHINHLERMRQDFVANVSHELRTPLTVIQGYLEMLLEMDSFEEDHLQWLTQMQEQGGRMQELVEGLLKLSQIENKDKLGAEKNAIDVPRMLNNLIGSHTRQNNPVNLILECEPNLKLLGNSQDIQSLFSNIVTNAIKYSPDGGDVTINWFTKDNKAYFSVKDQGMGIAKKHIPRLTERFYRVDKSRSYSLGRGGTGLGLAIVKHILIQHQAELDIESEPNLGSHFTSIFPEERTILKAFRN